MRSPTEKDKPGILFRGDATTRWDISPQEPPGPNSAIGFDNSLAFAGLYLFTCLLYARPNELWPGIFGTFPITKIVAVATALTYGASMLNTGRPTIWPLEVRMLLLMVILAVLFMPFAISPQESVDTLSNTFFKVVLIFVLIINLVTSHKRLHSMLNLMLICASGLAVGAIRDFLAGRSTKGRIYGAVGGMFDNPNDFAAALALLVRLGVELGLGSKRLARVPD